MALVEQGAFVGQPLWEVWVQEVTEQKQTHHVSHMICKTLHGETHLIHCAPDGTMLRVARSCYEPPLPVIFKDGVWKIVQ